MVIFNWNIGTFERYSRAALSDTSKVASVVVRLFYLWIRLDLENRSKIVSSYRSSKILEPKES
jgi:hypothetical protein